MKCFHTHVKTVVGVKDLLCEADIEGGLLEARHTMSILRFSQRAEFRDFAWYMAIDEIAFLNSCSVSIMRVFMFSCIDQSFS